MSSVLVAPNGQDIVELTNDGNSRALLQAARVGLGRLGVLVEIRLKVSRAYKVRRKEVRLEMGSTAEEWVRGARQMVEIASTMEHCWIHWPMMTVREGVHRKSSAGGGCDESENEALVLGLERVTVEEDGEERTEEGGIPGWYNGRNWFR